MSKSKDREKVRRRFAEDQTAAAAAQALEAALEGMAGTLAPVWTYDAAHLRPYDREVEARFDRYLYDDPDAQFCYHLAGTPQLNWYLVPGCPVGCPQCVALWVQSQVTPEGAEDTACDICRAGPNQPGTFDERRLIVQVGVPAGQPAPVCTIIYLVCARCLATEGA